MKKYIYIIFLILLSGCTKQEEIITKKENPVFASDQSIYFLWDSITAWYLLPIEKSFPVLVWKKLNIKTINAWKSWDTSKWLRERLQWTIEDASSWDIVFILIWWNDWLQWLPIKSLKENLLYIIDKTKSKNLVPIIWQMQIPTNLDSRYRYNFENIYLDVSVETNSIIMKSFLSEVWWIPEYNLIDGIHPNEIWHKILWDNIVNFINKNNLIYYVK